MSALKGSPDGLRTYGMLCPLLPASLTIQGKIDELVRFAKNCGVEEVYCEPVNTRGNSLTSRIKCFGRGVSVLRRSDLRDRKGERWSSYVTDLLERIQAAMRKHWRSTCYGPLIPLRLDRAGRGEDSQGCG